MDPFNQIIHCVVSIGLVVLIALVIMIALVVLALVIKILKGRGQRGGKEGLLQVHKSTKFEMHESIASRLFKEKKRLLKVQPDGKAGLTNNGIAESKPDKDPPKPVICLTFDGDLFASERHHFAELVDEIVANGQRVDSVVVVVNSPGGGVAQYGQMFSEMERIRATGLDLTVCVDTYAASGGYLMSLPANKIVAAPYSLVGSIGVVSEFVNGYRFLKDHGFDPVTITAGKFKRTITPLSEITQDGTKHYQEQLEAIHRLFVESVRKYRNIDTDRVCNGDHWTAKESMDLNLGLIDVLGTSQDYLFKINQTKNILMLTQKKNLLEQRLVQMFVSIAVAMVNRFRQTYDLYR